MKELSVGDSVSIGGKNYTIGSTAADAQKIVTGQEKAGGKVTVNGVEYTYNDTDKNGKMQLVQMYRLELVQLQENCNR